MGFYLNYSNRLFLCALGNLIPYSLPPQYLIMFSIQILSSPLRLGLEKHSPSLGAQSAMLTEALFQEHSHTSSSSTRR